MLYSPSTDQHLKEVEAFSAISKGVGSGHDPGSMDSVENVRALVTDSSINTLA